MNITAENLVVIESLSKQQRETLFQKLRAVEAVVDRQRGSQAGEVARQAAYLGVSPSTIQRWISQVKSNGSTGLIDRRAETRTSLTA